MRGQKNKIAKLNGTSLFREARSQVIPKAMIVIRHDNMPQLLKPVRLAYERVCAVSGMLIPAGDYAYPCHENPVRLSPTGNGRVLINVAEAKGQSILPEGVILMRIPTSDQVMSAKEIREANGIARQKIEQQAQKMLVASRV